MAKKIYQTPVLLYPDHIIDIYSVSCGSNNFFSDYINYWKHNGYWFYDSPDIIKNLAKDNSIDLSEVTYFYYEAYELEFNEQENKWQPFKPESSFETNIVMPQEKYLEGYDVVTFTCGNTAEYSPLSCNGLVTEIPTNKHCLLRTFEEAKKYLDNGGFNGSEPGPYRIFAVYSLKKPLTRQSS